MSLRFVPTFAVTITGRRISFDFLKKACQEALERRVWSLKDFADMNLWLHSYSTGGALPGSQLFLSPFSGMMVKFPQVLEDLVLASDHWAEADEFYDVWEDDLLKMAEIVDWIDDEKENIDIKDPEDHDDMLFLMDEDLDMNLYFEN